MKGLLFWIIGPAVVLAVIDVDITADKSERRATVHASGQNIEGLTYPERGSFGITDNKLKTLIQNYYGKYPLNAYLDKPGGEHPTELYEKHGWTPVTRTLYVLRSIVVGLKSEPTIVARQKFVNHSKKNATYNAAISQEIANEVSTTWSSSKEITVGQEINYGVNIGVASIGGTTHFSFSASWGKEETKSETVTVGTTSAVTVTLEPNEICIAELTATRGTMTVLVEYEAFLQGSIAFVYSSNFKGSTEHHLDINDILYFNKLPEEIRRNETIKIGFYADVEVIISDSETNNELAHEDGFIVDPNGGGPYGDGYLINMTTTTIRPTRKNRG